MGQAYQAQNRNINGILVGEYNLDGYERDKKHVIQQVEEQLNLYPNYQLKSSPMNPLFVPSNPKIKEGSKLALLAQSKIQEDRFEGLGPSEKIRLNVQLNKKNKIYKFIPGSDSILDTGAQVSSHYNEMQAKKNGIRIEKLDQSKGNIRVPPLQELNVLFDDVVKEIEDRQNWLSDMEAIVSKDKGRDVEGLKKTKDGMVRVKNEIVDRVGELEKIVNLIKVERGKQNVSQ